MHCDPSSLSTQATMVYYAALKEENVNAKLLHKPECEGE